MIYCFDVPGDPVGQPRHRFSRGRAYLPDDDPIHAWKQVVQFFARRNCREPLTGPVGLLLVFAIDRPKDHFRKRRGEQSRDVKEGRPSLCTAKPDFDNLAKAIADALNGIAFDDDKQVAFSIVLKRYVSSREDPGVEILIASLGEGVLESVGKWVKAMKADGVFC